MSIWPFDDKQEQANMPLQWKTDPDWKVDRTWKVRSMSFGYSPDLPDVRDFHMGNISPEKLETLQKSCSLLLAAAPQLPPRVNNIRYCSPIENQGNLGSCTAQAVVGLVEYMQRRAGHVHIEGSRLFVYKVSRKLDGVTGDVGSYLRTAMKAMVTFGVPPEQYCPYEINKFEDEPDAFLYAFASNYQALDYTRLDPPNRAQNDVLTEIKKSLASGLGVVFGFSVYSSISNSGDIPFPTAKDRLKGGHAVMAVGYDDNHGDGGALIIRNSWGEEWGYQGYGFLPYKYVTEGLARDFWVILKEELLDLEQFS